MLFEWTSLVKMLPVVSFLGEVRMPSGKVAKPDITDNKDGTVTVRYAPTEAGLHEMDIRYDNMHIPGNSSRDLRLVYCFAWTCLLILQFKMTLGMLFTSLGSPLQFYVDYVNSGHVTAFGPGLIHGVVNKPAVFTVNTKDAGEGELAGKMPLLLELPPNLENYICPKEVDFFFG